MVLKVQPSNSSMWVFGSEREELSAASKIMAELLHAGPFGGLTNGGDLTMIPSHQSAGSVRKQVPAHCDEAMRHLFELTG